MPNARTAVQALYAGYMNKVFIAALGLGSLSSRISSGLAERLHVLPEIPLQATADLSSTLYRVARICLSAHLLFHNIPIENVVNRVAGTGRLGKINEQFVPVVFNSHHLHRFLRRQCDMIGPTAQ